MSDQRSFLLVEGAGTLDRLDVEGDAFKATPIVNSRELLATIGPDAV